MHTIYLAGLIFIHSLWGVYLSAKVKRELELGRENKKGRGKVGAQNDQEGRDGQEGCCEQIEQGVRERETGSSVTNPGIMKCKLTEQASEGPRQNTTKTEKRAVVEREIESEESLC